MKKECVVMILLFLSISLVSATYQCNDGDFEEERKEIDVGDTKSANGIRIGVLNAFELGVINKISAELLVDAKKITLNNETSLKTIELLSGDYDIELINITGDEAIIEVENDEETIIEGEWTDIDDGHAMLVSINGEEIEVMFGKEKIELSNTENPEQLITIEDTEYLIEIASASDSGVTIKVKTCTGEITEISVEEPIVNETITNETEVNDTEANNSVVNDTVVNDTEANETSDNIDAKGGGIDNKESKGLFSYQIPLFVQIILFVVVIIALVLYLKNRANKKNQKNSESKENTESVEDTEEWKEIRD